ncbi:PQQ-binding-like beta-propeller repeat protein [Fervidobacterium thailandense]|uniref:outer membrane protein assembly factor BamB family protein n=1 Tax=Fervidobacterium thailandense TaxID=1008305 RepID=UPI001300D3DE|nr:PQQ-binding-like beta-propeller repeat protein [Fervidobacterium thailandense]
MLILSDLHYPPTRRVVDSTVEQLVHLRPLHTFLLGDLTEMGTEQEFAEFGKLLKKLENNFGACSFLLGNHDTRWTDCVRKDIKIRNALYRVFEVVIDDVTFIGLDSSLFFEHVGHFGDAQLSWLTSKLESNVNRSRNFVFFSHHPISYTDDGWKLYQLSERFNVTLHLSGHTHKFTISSPVNGLYTATVGAAKDGWATVLSWDENNFYIWKTNDGKNFELLGSISRDLSRRLEISKKFSRSSSFQPKYSELLTLSWNTKMENTSYSPPVRTPTGYAFSDYSGNIYSFDENGKLIWRATIGPTVSNLVSYGEFLYAGDLSGRVYLLKASDGKVLATQSISEPVFSISVGLKTVGIGAGRSFYLLESKSLMMIKKYDVGGVIQKPANFSDGKYIFASWSGGLYFLNETGEELKEFKVGKTYYTAAGCTPQVFERTVIYTHFAGYIQALSIETGLTVWTIPLSGVGFSDVLLVNSNGYCSTINGEVMKFDLRSGKVFWKVKTGASVYGSSPQLFREGLIIGNLKGELILLDGEHGIERVRIRPHDSFLLRKVLVDGDKIVVSYLDGTVIVLRRM